MLQNFQKTLLALIILLIISGNVSSYFCLAGYHLNKEYVEQILCINKDKPEMKCKGTCHLKDQLKKEEERNENRSGSEILLLEMIFFFSEKTDEGQKFFSDLFPLFTGYKDKFHLSLITTDIFQPPQESFA